jgi:isochorismate hydrolase
MGIQIESYQLPSAGHIPVADLPWRPDPDRAALLIHDMQRYFLDFYPETAPPRPALVENLVRLRQAATRLGLPTWYTAQPGSMSAADRGLLQDVWGPGMQAEPGDTEIIPELAPQPGDVVLTKWRYSAFFRTDLLEQLRAAGRDQLVIGGIYGHVGILTTAIESYTHDLETFLVADAIADFGPQQHAMTLDLASRTCAVTTTTDAVLADLGAAAGSPRTEVRV